MICFSVQEEAKRYEVRSKSKAKKNVSNLVAFIFAVYLPESKEGKRVCSVHIYLHGHDAV